MHEIKALCRYWPGDKVNVMTEAGIWEVREAKAVWDAKAEMEGTVQVYYVIGRGDSVIQNVTEDALRLVRRMR